MLRTASLLINILLSGCSLHIWYDQWASSWPLFIRDAFPHIKFHSEYYTAALFGNIKTQWYRDEADCSSTCTAGRTCGYGHWSSVDSVGGNWRPGLPTNSRHDKSSSSDHCWLQQHSEPKLHNHISLEHFSISDHTIKVSQFILNKIVVFLISLYNNMFTMNTKNK